MQSLNPKLFECKDSMYVMIPEVRDRLIDIADTFLSDSSELDIKVYPADIRLVGSNAGYDYNDKSDIDLHIVVNTDLYTCDPSILQCALNIFRQKFNQEYNISIKGIEVELYVEDIKSATMSAGIYSILQNRWIKFPEPEPSMEDFIDDEVKEKTARWVNLITAALDKPIIGSDEEVSLTLADCQQLLNRLYLMRKTGLEKEGRLSKGNLIFKQVRNTGMLDALKSRIIELTSSALTLESWKRWQQ